MAADAPGIWKAYIDACAAAENCSASEVEAGDKQLQIRKSAAARIAAGLASEQDRDLFATWHQFLDAVTRDWQTR